jgi:hypothetical protein
MLVTSNSPAQAVTEATIISVQAHAFGDLVIKAMRATMGAQRGFYWELNGMEWHLNGAPVCEGSW